MKKPELAKKILPSVLLWSILIPAARAERPPYARFQISFGGGPNPLSGYMAEKYEDRWGLGIEIAYRFHKNIAIIAGFHNSFSSYDISGLGPDVFDIYGTSCDSYGLYGGLKGLLPVGDRLTLYVSGGAGSFELESSDLLYNQRHDGSGGGSVLETTLLFNVLRKGYYFGLTGGVGIEYELSRRFSVFAEVRMVHIFTTEKPLPPEWAGLSPEVYRDPPDAIFIPLRIGLSFRI
jgi:hypothetical protein